MAPSARSASSNTARVLVDIILRMREDALSGENTFSWFRSGSRSIELLIDLGDRGYVGVMISKLGANDITSNGNPS